MQATSTLPLCSKASRPRVVWRPQRKSEVLARTSHVDVLRRGVRAWNRWRQENPGLAPVLNDLDLSVGDRQFGPAQGGPVNLSRTELCGAQLGQATLVAANMMGAVLTRADLTDARLTGADLRGARLAYAVMTGTRLDGANLSGADLRLAKGLCQAQIDVAVGDLRTSLPAHLSRPGSWLNGAEARPGRPVSGDAGVNPGAGADPYAVLGVGPGDTMEDVRVAWLRLVEQLGGEGSDGGSAGARLGAVNQAYQSLKDLKQGTTGGRAARGRSLAVWVVSAILLCVGLAAAVQGIEAHLARTSALIETAAYARAGVDTALPEGTSGARPQAR
jgi:hypothetical protein